MLAYVLISPKPSVTCSAPSILSLLSILCFFVASLLSSALLFCTESTFVDFHSSLHFSNFGPHSGLKFSCFRSLIMPERQTRQKLKKFYEYGHELSNSYISLSWLLELCLFLILSRPNPAHNQPWPAHNGNPSPSKPSILHLGFIQPP